ncbi:MAG: hypothetical protein Kow0031_38690 [Anaerolineae bacterium]
MSNQPKTGSVSAKSIKARNIVTGIDLSGADDDTLKAAVELMKTLHTGDVIAEEGIELSGDIITGLSAPQNRQEFVVQVQALRQQLVALAAEPGAPAEIAEAAEEVAVIEAKAQADKPLAKRITGGLRNTIDLLTDAGKLWETSSKAGPLLLKALATASSLYLAAQTLF